MHLVAELKKRLEAYYNVDDESELSSVAEAVLQRGLADAHSETDDDLLEELRDRPLPEVRDKDFESDFEEMHETDEELIDLYNARQHVEKKMKSKMFFNMDDTKWDAMMNCKIPTDEEGLRKMKEREKKLKLELGLDDTEWDDIMKSAEESGLSNMKQHEDILEDMLHWDKQPGQWNLCFPLALIATEEVGLLQVQSLICLGRM